MAYLIYLFVKQHVVYACCKIYTAQSYAIGI